MKSKIKTISELAKIIKTQKGRNRTVILVHGVFDIFHHGHLYLLSEAKKLGDILIVGIDHDENVRMIKGPKRPYCNHQLRMSLISSLEIVDYVFLLPSFNFQNSNIFFENFFKKLYKTIDPDI